MEKVTGATGSVQWNDYLFAGGQMVGEHFKVTTGGVTNTSTRYFTLDHLGSIAVIADETGTVLERLSYDAWGKRRFPTGADDPTGSITSQTTRGFTGHEMIDDVGLVNMNGRIYDPEIGRFLSADPYVQDLTNSQHLNRYSYVNNNPLAFTDPSGFFSIGKLFRTIIAVVVVVIAAIYGQAWVAGAIYGVGTPAAAACTTVCGAIAGAVAGGISAGITSGGQIKSILVGAVGGAAFGALGASTGVQNASLGARVAAYGTTGGLTSVAGGGSFQSGFLAAGFSTLAGPVIGEVANDNVIIAAAGSSMAGGVASVLGGGKFANGAITGAFAYAVASRATPAVQNTRLAFQEAAPVMTDAPLLGEMLVTATRAALVAPELVMGVTVAAILIATTTSTASREQDELPQYVVRGGTNSAYRFANGSGVSTGTQGLLNGVSVQSYPGVSVKELSQRQWIPQNQIGVSTVSQIKAAGGTVVLTPTPNGPYHATLSGITAVQAESLFTPTMPNPNPRDR